jgi:ubiquinone/menaquinone biosynthesis C-methylase UbiE
MSRDLMRTDELRAVVREAYAAIGSTTEAIADKLYPEQDLAGVPRSAIEGALGVANHLRWAEIDEGETILDVGCGAGIDSVLAARRTGPTGRVFALDFLPEMLERTSRAAAEAGLDAIEPLEGEMEAIPLADRSVDHVISNGVINLAARKRRVLAECARVLRDGGKLTVADLTVVDEELPPEVLLHPATWAG